MDVETKAGWIYAVRQLADAVEEAGGGDITSDSITDASVIGKTLLKVADQAAARTAIAAKAADYVPTWAEVSGKPATFPPTIGTTAATAKAGNYAPTTMEVGNALKSKAQIAALTPIADPATATEEDVATLLNEVIAALQA